MSFLPCFTLPSVLCSVWRQQCCLCLWVSAHICQIFANFSVQNDPRQRRVWPRQGGGGGGGDLLNHWLLAHHTLHSHGDYHTFILIRRSLLLFILPSHHSTPFGSLNGWESLYKSTYIWYERRLLNIFTHLFDNEDCVDMSPTAIISPVLRDLPARPSSAAI